MNKKYYIVLILICWAGVLFAQGPSFTATVSQTEVAVGQQFQIDFALNTNGDRFAPPSFTGFQVLSGPNVSTSMTSINGATTVANTYSYILAADHEGDFSIGPATIYINGRIAATRPIRMHVVKGQPQNRRTIRQQQQQQQANDVEEVSAGDMSKTLFIKAVVDKTNVYIGEQLNVNYRLYTRVAILQNQLDKLPELNGFWSQDMNDKKQMNAIWHTEVLNGTKYNVADIKQTILFPQRSGNLTIDPLGMTFIVRQQAQARDIMEQFFGSFKDVKAKLKSQVVTIHVKELPTAGKPLDFSGAVGTFKIDANVDKHALKSNEALNYNVRVAGTGNIMLMKNLTTNFPLDFEKYDPKTTDTINKETGKITGSRYYNYLLIPRHEGKYTIDPLKFTYFNPATERYVTLSTKAFPIAVAKGDKEANVSALSSADKQDVKLLDKDIRYIKKDTGFTTGSDFFGSTWYYLLLLLGPLAFIVARIYRKWYERHNSDVVKVRSRRASKIAAKHLADAKKQLATKNSAGYYEALFKGIYGYLSFKLNIPYANLNQEDITENLRARSVSEDLIKQLQDTLDLCDMARFAPVSGISEQEVFEKTKNMINDIEDEI
ncbi:protein BatD [Mucilaginibacter mali]|uniref:Protein BatD n=1 Tax=Mucilaginibacter mali TaxID=2740462 RepID=A0A7D4Q123_9SPHI|nr:BatD family protein [Mucilaginibacter mali]QKJ28687.1 protein BatD [Mucilaginibacter mali]